MSPTPPSARMRALVATRFGGPEVLELREVPVPEPGPSEVRVRVAAAGLTPGDARIRSGDLRLLEPRRRFPLVLGSEVAGLVDALGPGVMGFAPGDRVAARLATQRLGGFAEYVVTEAALLARAPRSVDLELAAALPHAGTTALQMLRDELAISRGQTLLITGGASGVGGFAIQLAARAGARVATTSSALGRHLVERLGAEVVVDENRRPSDVLREQDGVLDLRGGAALLDAIPAARRGARVVSIAGVPEPRTATIDLRRPWLAPLFALASREVRRAARAAGVDYRRAFMRPSGVDLTELARRVDHEGLEIVLDRPYPLERFAEAFAVLESGRVTGELVLTL
ncbi:MAG: NADP-dependent oxidoreductase [Actinomycetales bacterium]|nr:NADP-dependent oxidoreductase [Actinomycetales bacterium]